MRVGFLSNLVRDVEKLFHHEAPKPAAPAPAAAPVGDAFQAAPTAPRLDLSGVGAPRAAAQVAGPATSPYYVGRVHADGRAFVGQDGQPFTYRGVSEFLLPYYLNDPNLSPEQREQVVASRMDERVQQGYSVLRTFDMIDWSSGGGAGARLHPFDDWDGYKASMEQLCQMAQDRGLYVELTMFTDLDNNIPRGRMNEYIDFMADLASRHENTFVEMVNEGFKNGLEGQALYDAAKRFKQRAPNVMLAGTSPTSDGINDAAGNDSAGHHADGREYADAPFDYVTIHSERADGDDGYRWVRHMKEGGDVGAAVNKPVVQDEPMGSAAVNQPGRRDSDPRHFRDGALVAHVTNQYFTFHNDRATTSDPFADVAQPGADQVHLSDLIPSDPRGTHFINGHWPDSPFDATGLFDGNGLVRLYTKMKDDHSGFYTYPVDVNRDIDLTLKQGTHLKVVDASNAQVLIDRDYASGEKLHLSAGQDVVIYGGSVEVPALVQAGPATPAVAGGADPVPDAGRSTLRTSPMGADAARELTTRLYRGILGREPDAGGLAGWAPQVAKGDLGRVVTAFLTSDEFAARRDAGLTRAQLATGLYQGLLARDPGADLQGAVDRLGAGDAAGLAAELAQAARTEAAGAVALPGQRPTRAGKGAPLDQASAEALVGRLYQALLGRDADLGGLQGYAGLARAGRTPEVINALVSSDEFRARAAGLTVGGLAADLYRAILGRDPDQGGLASAEDAIGSGNLADWTLGMVRSPEYAQR